MTKKTWPYCDFRKSSLAIKDDKFTRRQERLIMNDFKVEKIDIEDLIAVIDALSSDVIPIVLEDGKIATRHEILVAINFVTYLIRTKLGIDDSESIKRVLQIRNADSKVSKLTMLALSQAAKHEKGEEK